MAAAQAHALLQIEGQQMERNQNQQEKAALAKLERIKLDQGKRADDLERDAAEAESKVSLSGVMILLHTGFACLIRLTRTKVCTHVLEMVSCNALRSGAILQAGREGACPRMAV